MYEHKCYIHVHCFDYNCVCSLPESNIPKGLKEIPTIDLRINSTAIKLALERQQITYQEYQITELIDISCMMAKEHTRDKDLMLDFLTYIKDFRKSASEELFETVMSFFRQTSLSSKADDGNEIIYFPENCVAFAITK